MSTPLTFEGEYAPMQMVERAVRNARPHDPGKHPRWVAVHDTLAYGSTTSQQLCIHFGLDPHELVGGPACEACAERDRLDGDGEPIEVGQEMMDGYQRRVRVLSISEDGVEIEPTDQSEPSEVVEASFLSRA